MRVLDQADRLFARMGAKLLREHARQLDELRFAVGALQARIVRQLELEKIQDAEFKAFSQFGEDGIVQYLVEHVPVEREAFVEIGVGSYEESNTRFLLMHDNWEGAIFDAGSDHLRFLRTAPLSWRHTVRARSAVVTVDNVNALLEEAQMQGDIGLLSIDIDGNDFWILRSIAGTQPRILIAEYNSLFGPTAAVTVPYEPHADRYDRHPSGLYFGASLGALHALASEAGYRLVGCNSVGSNAFFVRSDVAGALPDLTPRDAYVQSRFRQRRSSHDVVGRGSDHEDGLSLIAHLPVLNLATGATVSISEVSGTIQNR